MGLALRKKFADIGERVFWTAVQAGLGVVSVEAFDIPIAWAPVFAAVLSAVKSYVASRVGTGSSATLPQSLERK